MPRRTLVLLIILLVLSAAALWANFDSMQLGKFYKGWRQAQALMLSPEKNDQILKELKAEFGEGSSFGFTIDVNQDGVLTKTVQAIQYCGSVDERRYLGAVVQRVHRAGAGWPDKVEFKNICGFTKPPSFNITPKEMLQALPTLIQEHSMCRDFTYGPYTEVEGHTAQPMSVGPNTVEVVLDKDEDGNVAKAHWTMPQQFDPLLVQHRMMLCMTYSFVRLTQPELTDAEVLAAINMAWPTNARSTLASVGRFKVETKTIPMEMVAYPTR